MAMHTEIRKRMRSRKLDNLFCISFLAFFLLQWAVFWVYGNINSIGIAFTRYDRVTGEHIILTGASFFDNFKSVFHSLGTQTGKYLLNGVWMHVIASFVCLPLSYMIAYIIYKKTPLSGVFQVILYLPVILSSLITTLLFKHIIESGLYGFAEQHFGVTLPHLFTNPQYNWIVIMAYILFYNLPGSLLINMGSMARVPKDLIEYGELEGISMFREFLLVIVPLIFPVLQVQCLGLFTGIFTTRGPLFEIYASNAPENLKTFGYYLFVSVYAGNADAQSMFGINAAASLLMGLVSVPLVQMTKWAFDKIDPGAEF